MDVTTRKLIAGCIGNMKVKVREGATQKKIHPVVTLYERLRRECDYRDG